MNWSWVFNSSPLCFGLFARLPYLLGNPYSWRDGPSEEENDQWCELTADEPYQCEEGYLSDVTSSTADELEICTRQKTVENGLVKFGLATGKDLMRKCPSELVVCPDGLKAGFVKEGICLAHAEVVLVLWEMGKLLRKAQRRWTCSDGWIEGDRCGQGALKWKFRFRFA